MVVEDQTLALTFLRDPKTHGEFASSVVTVETHISVIVLVGWRAFKLKRAVRLPYVDFSTAPKRLFACQRELELNRRTAPAIYRAVRRITREANGSLGFDGQGPLVDAVVEMVRFDEETLFDRMAATRGALTQPLLTETARTIARFHAKAAVDHSRSGSAIMHQVITINSPGTAVAPGFRLAQEITGRSSDVVSASRPVGARESHTANPDLRIS